MHGFFFKTKYYFCWLLSVVLFLKRRLKKCILQLEWNVVRFLVGLSSCGNSYHMLGLAPEKAQPPVQLSFTLAVDKSIASGEWGCQSQSLFLRFKQSFRYPRPRPLNTLKIRSEILNLTQCIPKLLCKTLIIMLCLSSENLEALYHYIPILQMDMLYQIHSWFGMKLVHGI